ncbi:hypothetical protein LUZ63_006011 [Rhynchospora breviuscula]|uniref:Uncharacterized protein n=1 Tax=Rhynchospora breviuscula TaxID=2022672 RepID=A0A9Q0HT49_9POAL|nr:hypothetical protein LUZ63_006011 [Rhynchospora breviuscula]
MAGEEESSSSGCQSGWTVYFDQSYLAPPPLSPNRDKDITRFKSSREESEEEEEEDLSMVSDASSGPPHFDTEEQHSECDILLLLSESRKKRKVDRLSDAKRDLCSSLDDTASSPMMNHSNSTGIGTTDMETTAESALEFSCAFSGTYIKEESALQKNRGYLETISSLKLPITTTIMYYIYARITFSPFFLRKKLTVYDVFQLINLFVLICRHPNKKIKRKNRDAFSSWSSQEQSMQEFL